MAGIRIRWRGVARVAAIAILALVAVQLLPGLLRAPEPPPLAADVGLPRVAPVGDVPRGGPGRPVATAPGRQARTRPHRQRRRSRRRRSRPHTVADAPASKAVIGSETRRRAERSAKPRTHPDARAKPPSRPAKLAESALPPAPEYSPPAAPEAAPEPAAEPTPAPPSTPGDGSQEFTPH